MRARAGVLLAVAVSVVVPSFRVEAQRAPSFTVDPGVVEVGGSVRVDGIGFEPGSVRIFVDATVGTSPLAEVDHTGAFSFLVKIDGVVAGDHKVIACNNQARDGACRQEAGAPLVVTRPTTTTTPPRVTTTTEAPRVTTTTAPPVRTTTTTSPPARTTTTLGSVARTTLPPVATLAPTTVGALGVPTTFGPIPTTPGGLSASVPIGPDPTFDPTPDDLAIATTTDGPSFQSGDVPGDHPDLSVVALEVSQGIQNLTSRMPLVADRTTWVRVHVDSSGTDSWAPIDGALLLERAGQPDEVLVPENGPIATKQPRTDLDSTLNFELPDDYLDAGELTLTALVWSFGADTLDTVEPDPENNMMEIEVEFHTADVPTIWLAALDDGAGPGPVVDDVLGLLGFASLVMQDMLDFHPTASVNFEAYPSVIGPGPEALEPGEWKLGWGPGEDPDDPDNEDTDQPRRTEPNTRLAWLTADLPADADVLGMFDSSIPADGFTGWAKHGVSWSKPSAGTPAHEIGHNRGLKHVACKDSDDDGVPDELKGGAIDPYHPTGLPPNCSLAPISTTGYYGLTTERDSLTVYSNDPTDPDAAFPIMSYKSPKWNDPYHWCILLDFVSVPCDSATTGVPPKVLLPAADCDPEPVGNGFNLELCLIHQLPPPADPIVGSPNDADASPIGRPLGYAFQPVCDGDATLFMRIPDAGGAPDDSEPQCIVESVALDTIVAPHEPRGWMLVSGYVDLVSGEAEIQQMATRDVLPESLRRRYVDNVIGALSGASPMSYVVAVRNADGVVSQIPVDLDGAGHGDGGERGTIVSFFQAVPAADDCTECWIEIRGASGLLVEQPFGAGRPEVTEVSATDKGDATLIEWAAADPDGDPLTFDVLWSGDGETWLHAATGVAETSLSVPHSARFPGGDGLVVQVVANDGVRSASRVSEPFVAPGHEPLMVVSGLPESGAVEQYDTVLLQAHVVDPEDAGTQAETVVWLSDLDGEVATGAILRTRDLTVGRHTFTVTAEDSDRNPVAETFELEVAPRTSPTRYLETPDAVAVAMLTGAETPVGQADGSAAVGGEAAGAADDAEAVAESGADGSGVPIAIGVIVIAGAAAAGGVLLARRRRAF